MIEIPADIASLAADQKLGAIRRVFPPARKRMLLFGTAVFGLVLGGPAAVIDIAAITSATSGGAGPPIVVMAIANVLGLTAVAAFVWALSTTPMVSKKARDRKVYWYDEGYIQMTRRVPVVVKWSEVLVVYASMVKLKVGLQHHYRLTVSGGRQYTLDDNVVEMSAFGPELLAQVAQAQLPRSLAVLGQGKPLDFGPIMITGQGVSVKGKAELPWTSVTRIDLDGGHVCISQAGKTSRQVILAATVPNLGTLLEVAKTKTGAPA